MLGKTAAGKISQVTVHDEVVAEIKKPPVIKPSTAAVKLLELRKKLRYKRKRYKLPIFEKELNH